MHLIELTCATILSHVAPGVLMPTIPGILERTILDDCSIINMYNIQHRARFFST